MTNYSMANIALSKVPIRLICCRSTSNGADLSPIHHDKIELQFQSFVRNVLVIFNAKLFWYINRNYYITTSFFLLGGNEEILIGCYRLGLYGVPDFTEIIIYSIIKSSPFTFHHTVTIYYLHILHAYLTTVSLTTAFHLLRFLNIFFLIRYVDVGSYVDVNILFIMPRTRCFIIYTNFFYNILRRIKAFVWKDWWM